MTTRPTSQPTVGTSWWSYGFVVILLHVLGVSGILLSLRHNLNLTGLAFVSYTLGLRHAFDADHIAAIDNTVRNLLQRQRPSSGVGFYFSLGHSSVVFALTIATAVSVDFVRMHMPGLEHFGSLLGTAISAAFLVFIGILNAGALRNLIHVRKSMRENSREQDALIEGILQSRGFVSRWLGPLFRLIRHSWQAYPLGFLFGLGFDTASEIALLVLSATAAKAGLPVFSILSLPLLFAAGMSLMDTLDGVFMTLAYGWADKSGRTRLRYNLAVTALSVAAAFVIGLAEFYQLLSSKLPVRGLMAWFQHTGLHWAGYVLVGVFLLSWVFSFVRSRLKNPRPCPAGSHDTGPSQ